VKNDNFNFTEKAMTDASEITNYDSISAIYLAHTERPDSWNNLYERPYMLSQFPSFFGKHVLDLGCGSGFYTEYALVQGGIVTAIDASQILVDRLKKHFADQKAKFICADIAQPLSFIEPEAFDYVICSLVIHYVKDWPPLLAELFRIMKKDGLLFISTHHPYLVLDYSLLKNVNYFETTFVEDTWGKKKNPFKVHYYTRSLTATLKPVINSRFKILDINEPLPDDRCQQISPETYQRLRKRPGFLFITLQK